MKTNRPAHISDVIGRIRAAWAEMDYAQRRLFEARTGISVEAPRQRTPTRTTIEELEALYRA